MLSGSFFLPSFYSVNELYAFLFWKMLYLIHYIIFKVIFSNSYHSFVFYFYTYYILYMYILSLCGYTFLVHRIAILQHTGHFLIFSFTSWNYSNNSCILLYILLYVVLFY